MEGKDGLYQLVDLLPGLLWALRLLYLLQLGELLLTEFDQLTLGHLRQLCWSQAAELLFRLKTHAKGQNPAALGTRCY